MATALQDGGKPPKVALRESSGGLPAGTVGTVVRLDDPAESDEYVVVRIANDELPFTPAELEPPPPRGKRAKPEVPKAEFTPATTDGAAGTKADPPQPAATGNSNAAPPPASPPADRQPAARAQAAAQSAPPAASRVTTPTESAGRAAARQESSRKAAGKKQAPKLTVSLQYDERGWTVEASRGTRAVVKAMPVRPAAAMQVAQLLENEQVSQAIADIVQAERDEAERKAAELRAQLAEVEAVLAGYDES